MSKLTTSIRLEKNLKEKLERIAEREKRSLNSVIEIALDEWIHVKETLHPDFIAEIKEALSEVRQGQIEPYERG